jgi:nitrogen fixation/metabolism regulation signal transduction histidine kinase
MYWVIAEKQYLRSIYLIVVIAYQVWNLYTYFNRVARDFYSFILAMANEEYSIQFNIDNQNRNTKMLHHLYNTTATRFQKIKYDRDLQHLFLEEILNQIEVGIVAFDDNSKILLMNRAFKMLFGCNRPTSVSGLPESFKGVIDEVKLGQRKLIFPVVNGEKLTLSSHSTQFNLRDKRLTLVYFHNIKSEMDEQELESWQKLFSVLTHEIMNSITPISSLASSLNDKLKRDIKDSGELKPRTLGMLNEGLEAVTVRTQGLLGFTQSFRKFSKMPKPKPVEIEVSKLLQRIQALYLNSFQLKNLSFSFTIGEQASIVFADAQQFEQLLINLIKNAVEAFEGRDTGEIKVETLLNPDKRIEIIVSDNGIGISEANIDKVFIPFFTTKTSGDGIGLSLCRQIVRMHGGTMDIKSKIGEGTRVRVVF